VGEAGYQMLFQSVGASAGQGLALSVLYRVSSILIWSLPGALFLAAAGRPTAAEMERELAEEETHEPPPAG